MLTDEEAEKIRRGLAAGMRGPVLLKWCELLLADRDARRTRERERQARPLWPGPLQGPSALFDAAGDSLAPPAAQYARTLRARSDTPLEEP